jgi:hypothetical protein
MGSATTTRIGGLLGIASAAAVIPAYLVGSPEVPSRPADASQYYDSAASFLTANGTLPLLHLLFGLLFLGVLVSVLRAAAGPTGAVYVALLGGAVFFALTAAGLAAEVAVPAAIVRFGDLSVTQWSQPFLGLATWFYHYSQIGSAALIFATGYVIWRTGVLPKWSAALTLLGIPALLHLWIGVPSAYTTVAWIGLTGLLLLILPPNGRTTSEDVK